MTSPFPFNLWRCGRLICFRLLFAGANNCLWLISDFENKFSVAICQRQQSTIATVSLGLLKPAEVVSKIIGIIFLKLPNLPKFSTTLNSPCLPLFFGAKQNLLSKKVFLIESKEIKNRYICGTKQYKAI